VPTTSPRKHRLAEIGLLTKCLDVLARQFSRICRSGGTAEVTHRDLVTDTVCQNTAGVHVTRRFQQIQGQAGVALCHACCPGLLPAVIARFLAPFVSWFF
jgi:hypothetical protein